MSADAGGRGGNGLSLVSSASSGGSGGSTVTDRSACGAAAGIGAVAGAALAAIMAGVWIAAGEMMVPLFPAGVSEQLAVRAANAGIKCRALISSPVARLLFEGVTTITIALVNITHG
ncbi:MAG: hypothetical protein EOP60_19635 [Sphingomonadales bacterium]|nr:MAG: hypothetical protein EOP60_19635 [Sphingomonadales bacterium]